MDMQRNRQQHRYTPEEIEWLKENQDNMTRQELSDAFNERFGANTTRSAIKHVVCDRHGLKRSVNEGQCRKSGRRKKGLPIGSEHEYGGYIWVKYNNIEFNGPSTEEQFKLNWMEKQRYVWEQVHGLIPEGHVIVFLDSNKRNFDIDNLYCMDRKWMPFMVKNKWFTTDREHTLTAIKWCELHYALHSEKNN